jgi:hypothetical protein
MDPRLLGADGFSNEQETLGSEKLEALTWMWVYVLLPTHSDFTPEYARFILRACSRLSFLSPTPTAKKKGVCSRLFVTFRALFYSSFGSLC